MNNCKRSLSQAAPNRSTVINRNDKKLKRFGKRSQLNESQESVHSNTSICKSAQNIYEGLGLTRNKLKNLVTSLAVLEKSMSAPLKKKSRKMRKTKKSKFLSFLQVPNTRTSN
jgi:hypothetical protein